MLIILIILGGVYFNYFANYNQITTETNKQNIKSKTDTNISKKKEAKNFTQQSNKKNEIKKVDKKSQIAVDEKTKINLEEENKNINLKKKTKSKKPKIDNLVKDIEYLTTDKSGNKYKVLASSGRTNSEDKNVLDLDNVRGVVTSEDKSAVYIVSDFAEYNSSSLQSNFYQNVVINYEDKEITCDYFNLDMQTNIAIAYNNVVVTDPQSVMKAGKIILNIETKVININPDTKKEKVTVTIN
tara:strand:- start:982 stop:1704 length:723 start_codon:yes stop_codon:yes gene_type:complete